MGGVGGGVKYIAQVNACEKQIFGQAGSVLQKWDKKGRKRERGGILYICTLWGR